MLIWIFLTCYGVMIIAILYALQMQSYRMDKKERAMDILMEDNLKLHSRTNQTMRDIEELERCFKDIRADIIRMKTDDLPNLYCEVMERVLAKMAEKTND